MDMFKSLITSNAGDMIGALTDVGFGADQAERFLPAFGDSLSAAAEKTDGLDLVKILAAVDINAIATAMDASPSLVQQGLQALLPMLRENVNLGSASGLLSAAKSLF